MSHHDLEGLARVGRIGAASLTAAAGPPRRHQDTGRRDGLTAAQYSQAVRIADMRTARIERAETAYRTELDRW